MIPTFPRSPDFLPQALSSLESAITSFPFFYRPRGLRLGDAWPFHPPECHYKRVAREVGAVVGTCGCGHAGPLRGEVMRHSLRALDLAFAPPCSQTNAWRLSEVNEDFSLCPSYPRAVIVPSAVDDDVLGAQRPLSPGRPLPCTQLPPRSPAEP